MRERERAHPFRGPSYKAQPSTLHSTRGAPEDPPDDISPLLGRSGHRVVAAVAVLYYSTRPCGGARWGGRERERENERIGEKLNGRCKDCGLAAAVDRRRQ